MSDVAFESVSAQRRVTKTWAERRRGVLAGMIVLPAAVVALASPPWVEPGSWLDLACRSTGWALLLAGTALRFWATFYVGGHKGSTLVVDGPYSITRNPLYLGTLAIALAVACFLESLTLGVGMCLAAVLYLSVTIPSETRRLREKHADAVLAYHQQTPALWPSLSRFTTRACVELDVRCLGLEARRALRWATIPILALVVDHLRHAPGWPTWFQWP